MRADRRTFLCLTAASALAAGSRAASSIVDNSQRLSDITLAKWCADNALTEIQQLLEQA